MDDDAQIEDVDGLPKGFIVLAKMWLRLTPKGPVLSGPLGRSCRLLAIVNPNPNDPDDASHLLLIGKRLDARSETGDR